MERARRCAASAPGLWIIDTKAEIAHRAPVDAIGFTDDHAAGVGEELSYMRPCHQCLPRREWRAHHERVLVLTAQRRLR